MLGWAWGFFGEGERLSVCVGVVVALFVCSFFFLFQLKTKERILASQEHFPVKPTISLCILYLLSSLDV